jgi:hypothetical protein
LRNLGAVPVLLESMKRHQLQLTLQQEACGAIVHLALNEQNRGLLGTEGAIAQVVRTMSEHSYDVKVQNHCCGALLNLSIDGN